MPRSARIAGVYMAVIGLVASASAQTGNIQGFADVNYRAFDERADDGFRLGQLAGHAAFGITDRLAVFSEVSLTGRSSGYSVEVERLMLRYEFSDQLKLSGGRYHTPISYWNTAFHHGLWLQTTVARPEYVQFGSRFVPVHFVGLLAEGTFPAHALGPGYFAGVGNGRAENIARAGDAGDVNESRAWLGGLFVRPARPFGLETGVAFYRDRLFEEGQVDETILAAYLVWTKESPEFLAEYARVIHEPVDEPSQSVGSDAFYVQLAYRLPDDLHYLKPYVRFERIDAPLSDPVFGPLALNYDAAIAGLRIDFAMLAALKVEYANVDVEDGDRDGRLQVQLSFTFPGTGGMLESNPGSRQ